MAATDNFAISGSTITIAATAASGSGTFSKNVAENSPNVRVFNAGPNTVFVRFGTGAQTAVLTDTPIPSGVVENFFKGSSDTMAAICNAAQTATVYFTPGVGT